MSLKCAHRVSYVGHPSCLYDRFLPGFAYMGMVDDKIAQHEKQHQGSLWQPEVWDCRVADRHLPARLAGWLNIIGQTIPLKCLIKKESNLAC